MTIIDDLLSTINSYLKSTGTSHTIRAGYLNNDVDFGIYATPNSRILDADFAGVVTTESNFEIAYRTTDQQEAIELLSKLSVYLDNLETLGDGSDYQFEKTNINSQPFIAQADVDGNLTFYLDFALVIKKKRSNL